MKTPVPDLDITTRYHLEDGTVTNADPPTDRVTLAELRYPCPHCDHPNVAAHTPPLVEGMVDTCDHCDQTHRLTPRPDTDDQPEILPATALSDAVDQLAEKRRARVLGERLPDAAITTARRGHRACRYTLIAGMAGPLTVFFIGALAAAVLFSAPESLSFIAGLVTAILWGLGSIGLFRAFSTMTHSRLTEYLDEEDAEIVASNVSLVEHGQDVSEGNADLYVPPRSDTDGRDRERELA